MNFMKAQYYFEMQVIWNGFLIEFNPKKCLRKIHKDVIFKCVIESVCK